jgi:hypothetical protein
MTPPRISRPATINAAYLGRGDIFGSLAPGKVCASAAANGVLLFCLERIAIRGVYVGGEPLMQDGQHPLQEEIVREFRETQQKLWGPG